jgi:hypothetical protein
MDQLGRRMGRAPSQAVTRVPADQDRNRKGGFHPLASNGQAIDVARNPVTAARRRRCRVSGRISPALGRGILMLFPPWIGGGGVICGGTGVTAVNVALGRALPRSNKVGCPCLLASYSAEATTLQTVGFRRCGLRWSPQNGVAWHYIEPSKPQ